MIEEVVKEVLVADKSSPAKVEYWRVKMQPNSKHCINE